MSSPALTTLPAFRIEDPALAIGIQESDPAALSGMRSAARLLSAKARFRAAPTDHPWLRESSGAVTVPPAKLNEWCAFMPDGVGGWLSYVIKPSARSRRIRVVLTPERIELRLPKGGYLEEGVSFLKAKRSWVREMLRIHGEALLRAKMGERRYFDFERRTLQYRGQPAQFVLGKSRIALLPLPDGGSFQWEIWLPLPQASGEEEVVVALKKFFMAYSRSVIARCYARMALRAKALPPLPWRLSSARTRWGSCSSRGQISLTWALAFFDDALIEYVCAHELAHLIEFNHSPAFWAEVAAICPEWQTARERLKQINLRLLPFA